MRVQWACEAAKVKGRPSGGVTDCPGRDPSRGLTLCHPLQGQTTDGLEHASDPHLVLHGQMVWEGGVNCTVLPAHWRPWG
eukprot:12389071-Karenia_brevis.AAC.1